MILVSPIGNIDEWLVNEVVDFVGDYYYRFGVRVKRGPVIPVRPFLSAYNPYRNQYLGRIFLPTLSLMGRRLKARAVLGLTELDLYEEGLNFIFGLANPSLKAAVVSIHRLKPEFYGEKPDEGLLMERTVKEAMHELGHVFGLEHCPNVRCVMHFSNSIYDTDVKTPFYCSSCEEKLRRNLEVEG